MRPNIVTEVRSVQFPVLFLDLNQKLLRFSLNLITETFRAMADSRNQYECLLIQYSELISSSIRHSFTFMANRLYQPLFVLFH